MSISFISMSPIGFVSLEKANRGMTILQFSSVQSLSRVQLFVTPWTTARQTSLSITSSQSLLKLMFIEWVMPSNHLILCCPLLLSPLTFPSISSFPMSQFFASGGQSIGISASVSVFPMNIQDWFPLGWLVWSPCTLRESSSKPQLESISSSALSLLYGQHLIIHTWLLGKP